MNAQTLAIKGGKPVRSELFPAYNPITDAELKAAEEVLRTGNLSQFLGSWHADYFGGPKVLEFEKKWCEAFDAKHCVSVNSATSGLIAALGAVGIGPGDEVIVTPYTFSASAAACFVYGAVPIFADIQDDIFCLDPKSIEKKITPRTKAIMVVHIFGHSADMDPIMALAKKHKLAVIEDAAQAPLATYKGRKVGTIGDIGVFSLNFHKHIHTGEGGMVTTNNAQLADNVQMIRNHGETSIGPRKLTEFQNLWGFNFRLTEVQAAIGITQLERLSAGIDERIEKCHYVAKQLEQFPGLTGPKTYDNCRHVFYVHAFKYDETKMGVPRDLFLEAVKAELPSAHLRETTGKLMSIGYVKPIYMQPIYQAQKGTSCSFNCPRYDGKPDYSPGICPVTERMHFKELFTHEYMRPPMTQSDLDDVVRAFEKVYEQRRSLLA